jgi:glutamate-1-semialdehyde 2,1-aminomutase
LTTQALTTQALPAHAGAMPRDPDRDARLRAFIAAEEARFIAARPKCAAAAAAGSGFYAGVPQHWMLDWPTPFPLVVEAAKGTRLRDIDGHELTDLCLGDTGAMFGHAPPALTSALVDSSEAGLTAMLPEADANTVAQGLTAMFGLPHWQIALSASDANRFALRVARAVTGRRKVLVFDGCYHGAVDEGGVQLGEAGATVAKPSLWGQAHDLSETTVCVPFNDEAALAAALATGEVACVMTEPALTNCGIVAPLPGFMAAVRRLTREAGTLLLIDETHTLSEGYGGWTRVHGLEPDILVAGKAIAGGVPCGVWGFTQALADGIDAVRARQPAGHSGVGTTLAGSLLQIRCLSHMLRAVITPDTYADMIALACALEGEIKAVIAEFALPWCVVRLGARLETVFSASPPTNAVQMRASFDPLLDKALHLGLINRGFLVTPFHAMLLAGPALPKDAPARYGAALRAILRALFPAR